MPKAFYWQILYNLLSVPLNSKLGINVITFKFTKSKLLENKFAICKHLPNLTVYGIIDFILT